MRNRDWIGVVVCVAGLLSVAERSLAIGPLVDADAVAAFDFYNLTGEFYHSITESLLATETPYLGASDRATDVDAQTYYDPGSSDYDVDSNNDWSQGINVSAHSATGPSGEFEANASGTGNVYGLSSIASMAVPVNGYGGARGRAVRWVAEESWSDDAYFRLYAPFEISVAGEEILLPEEFAFAIAQLTITIYPVAGDPIVFWDSAYYTLTGDDTPGWYGLTDAFDAYFLMYKDEQLDIELYTEAYVGAYLEDDGPWDDYPEELAAVFESPQGGGGELQVQIVSGGDRSRFTVIPEPASSALLLVPLLAVRGRRHRVGV